MEDPLLCGMTPKAVRCNLGLEKTYDDKKMIITLSLLGMVAITLLIGIGLSKLIELKPVSKKKNNLDKVPPEVSEGGHY